MKVLFLNYYSQSFGGAETYWQETASFLAIRWGINTNQANDPYDGIDLTGSRRNRDNDGTANTGVLYFLVCLCWSVHR